MVQFPRRNHDFLKLAKKEGVQAESGIGYSHTYSHDTISALRS